MKKFLIVGALAAMLTACGGATVNGVEYNSWGIANEGSQKNPNIRYEVSGWSVFWGIILCETLVVPVYVVGWDLFISVGTNNVDPATKGVVK